MKALPWKAVGLLLVLLALAGALYGAYLHGVNVTDLAWKAKWAKEASTQSEAVASKTTEYRTEEQRRQKAANQVANDARQEQTAALTDAAVADAAGERLRVEAGKLAAASCAPVDTSAAQRGKAANRAAMVLSELLSRSDARAGELAKYADSARITGLACNRFVDELTSTTNSARP
ncbi:hypothetical protein PSE10B_02390 [Pseudomonas amygdali pv. eriobotryae]|uniref:DUF2514 domain-containing protein n=1 Tax=Pseudomonas amygdali TaxID=47877 RepID=UPI00167476FB|nr:DUF2514 domain-containing protein [Pseudomonas amygdali]GFZ63717.1 hypothetical protein PSE10B_02390 [Pseudomonas amygdali pv. eriobotryae]